MKRVIAIVLLGLTLLVSDSAVADESSDKAAAEALFEEGKKLLKGGKYLEAAKKFKASQQLDAGIGTLLYMADAFEKAGKLASAWAYFREAEALAQQEGQKKRFAVAKERANRLVARLSKLQIDVGDNAKLPGLKVERDGAAVAAALLERGGVATPLDRGSYQLTVSAPGHASWKKRVELAKEGKTVTVRVPPLTKVAAAATKPKAGADNKPSTPSGKDSAASTGGASMGYKAAAIGLTAAGAVGLGLGIFFTIDALNKNDEASSSCGDTSCSTPEAADLTAAALTSSHIATVGYAVGGAALAGGVLMWILAPKNDAAAPAARSVTRSSLASLQVLPLVGPTGGGVLIGGLW